MLTQQQADNLLQAAKTLINCTHINFPKPGDSLTLEAETSTGNDSFLLDINRKGKISLSKCTLQNRHMRTIILLRVDLVGPPHTNPDLQEIPCPHIHIYREDYMDKWAYPLPEIMPTNISDLGQVLLDFLKYNNITNVPLITYQGGGLV
ncbi:hypothetical protein O0550_00145 [Brevibacillus halotolerans]|uniref:DUF6978 family protein n=1 Tax=Brevibacillus TaxID=55080 RepID=UPI00215CFD85|nr:MULTISPECIES: hypothetical protein [Brevibacillus]MCR8961619.1 hypothetical protein [Brevibacillus laterosporus]MCZ0833774.1 hypothetical protein [Brevibacillus halotolerans]